MLLRLLSNVSAWIRRSWLTLLVLGVALLSAQRVLAADTPPNDIGQTVLGVIGGIIASTIVSLFNQRHNLRTSAKADKAEAKVNTLARELGVDNPQTPTPDITKMQSQIDELEGKLETVQKELTTTLLERDTARELLGQQVDKNAEDMVNAQKVIDRLETRQKEQDDLIASQEVTISEYERHFQTYKLDFARLEGRLDEREKQEQLVSSIKSMTDSFLQVIGRLMPPAPQPEGTPS